MNYVIDFTGFYNDNRFIIEEYCECRVSQKEIEVGDALLFAIDPTDVLSYGSSRSGLENYYNTFGIGIKHSRHFLYELVEHIGQLLSNKKTTIYLKSSEKLRQLKDFMTILYGYDNVVCLNDKGFDVFYVVFGTDCPYHDDPNENYCVRNNAKLMANWLKEIKFSKCVAIIDFSGYRNSNGDFKVKEFCASVMNKFGTMIDKVSMVTVGLLAQENFEEIQAYNAAYYNKYGIKWKTGNSPLPILGGRVKKFLSNYDVTDIFVRDREIEMKLMSVVEDINKFEILRLTELGYTDAINIGIRPEICNFHEHPNPQKNVCAVFNTFHMVQFVFNMQLFKIEVLEDVKNFKMSSQKLIDEGNSSDNHSNLSNLTSYQTYADSDVDSTQPESGSDDLDDLLKDFHTDNTIEVLSEIDFDAILESQDIKDDYINLTNFDIDFL